VVQAAKCSPIIIRLNYESFRHLYQKPPRIDILDKHAIKRFQQMMCWSQEKRYHAIKGPDDLESPEVRILPSPSFELNVAGID
jgi:hypothetical protein